MATGLMRSLGTPGALTQAGGSRAGPLWPRAGLPVATDEGEEPGARPATVRLQETT